MTHEHDGDDSLYDHSVVEDPVALREGFRVLNEVLDPIIHHTEIGQLSHAEALTASVELLTENPELLRRAVDMFSGLIVAIALDGGYESPCGYLHTMIDLYKEHIGRLN